MGCDDYPLIAGRYQIIGGPVAVQWNPNLEEQFPDAEHRRCRQSMIQDGGRWKAHTPPICHDWHCPRCGAPTGMTGHQTCTTTTTTEGTL